jgi:hypothetical protein
MYITGTLTIAPNDYLTAVSAIDINVEGQMAYVTYINSSGQLRVASKIYKNDPDGTVTNLMSGCAIVQ